MGTHPIFESDFDCLTDLDDSPICCLFICLFGSVMTESDELENKSTGIGMSLKLILGGMGIFMFCQSKKKKKDEEKGVYCPIAQKTIQPPKTDVEDMAEILLAKADQVDITAGCEDCGGCSKSSKYKTTPEKELKTVA